MRVVEYGMKPNEYKTQCERCGTIFIYDDSELSFHFPHLVQCPLCGAYLNRSGHEMKLNEKSTGCYCV